MSINHYSSSDIPEPTTLWWNTQQHHEPSPSWASHLSQVSQSHPSPTHRPRGFNLNHDEEEEDDDNMIPQPTPQGDKGEATPDEEKEAMFEKPLTPSDVGKLNRLVIPKQHAEKYLPLGESGGESKGVSLSFEDECGKCWRFRYSYWNSSQSYVLTKGWSRYVKDKHLDAGDVVFFLRHRTHPHRLFIHCGRPRHHSPTTPTPNVALKAWTTTPRASLYSAHPYPTHPPHPFPYHLPPYSLHAGGGSDGDEGKTTSAVGNSSSSSSRVLRLFGVNMECQPDESGSSTPECSYVSPPQGTPTQHQHHHYYGHYYRQPSYSSNHMDVNQMRNRRG